MAVQTPEMQGAHSVYSAWLKEILAIVTLSWMWTYVCRRLSTCQCRKQNDGAGERGRWVARGTLNVPPTPLDSCAPGVYYAVVSSIRWQRHTQHSSSPYPHPASLNSSFYKGTSKRPHLPRTLSSLWTSAGAWRACGWPLPNTPSSPF